MPEVNTRFEQLLHGNRGQEASFVKCIRACVSVTRIETRLRGGFGTKLSVISVQLSVAFNRSRALKPKTDN
jgi:hypothetical protein